MNFRKIIQPFMMLFELLYLGICWIVAFIHPNTSQYMVNWAMNHLPNRSWYQNKK